MDAVSAKDGWTFRRPNNGAGFWERAVKGAPGVIERAYADDAPAHDRVTAYPVGVSTASSRSGSVAPFRSAAPTSAAAVHFTAEVIRQIRRECSTDNDLYLEKGGPLLGRVDGGKMEIVRSVVGVKARSVAAVTLDLEQRGGLLDDTVVCGDWHLHPSLSLDPSEGDIAGWRAAYKHMGTDAPYWVGIIVAAQRFKTPQLRAWVTDATGLHPTNL